MMRPGTIVPVTLTLCSAAAGAQSPEAIPVDQIRALMVQAIDAPSGRAAGTLSGPMAAALQSRFGSTQPLRVEVTTLRRLPDEGCRRLNVRFTQQDTSAQAPPGGARTIDFGINYCRDGSAPPRGRAGP